MTSKQPHPSEPCDNTSCWAYKEGFCNASCRPHSSATEPDANNLQTFPFSAVCCRKCSDHEPTCHDICGAYQTERDAAIREQAKREERERIAKQIEHNASNRKYHSYATSMQIVEYLRGEQL